VEAKKASTRALRESIQKGKGPRSTPRRPRREAAGPESVWGVVKTLGVERIGHGTTAVKDPALLKEIREKGIAIETCPVSNLRTGR